MISYNVVVFLLIGPPRTAPNTPPPAPTTTTTMPPVDPGMKDMPCEDGHVDAIFMTEDQRAYVFRKDYYLVLGRGGIMDGYPRKIRDDWPQLPDNIDAAITYDTLYGYVYDWSQSKYFKTKVLDERIFFFKGNQAYLYYADKKLERGYPKSISDAFPGLPNNIDGAFRWSRNDRPYFMKGTARLLYVV